jgi:hypothetical protein
VVRALPGGNEICSCSGQRLYAMKFWPMLIKSIVDVGSSVEVNLGKLEAPGDY